MKHGTFNEKDKQEFNSMMAKHDQLLKHQERKQAIKRMESKVTEPVKDNTGKGEAMSFIDDFKKQNKDTVQEDEDDTWISDTALTKDGKVRVNNLSSQGFYMDTLRGEKIVPWPSFIWWRTITTFFYASEAYKVNIQLMILGVKQDEERLTLSKHYLDERKKFIKENVESVIEVINDNFIVTIPEVNYIEARELYTELSLEKLDELRDKQWKEVKQLKLAYDELRKQSPLQWNPTDTSQVYSAFLYSMLYRIREKEVKEALRKEANKTFKKGQFIAKNKSKFVVKKLQRLLEEIIATPEKLLDNYLDKDSENWVLSLIGGSLIADQSEDIIKTINTFFEGKKKVASQ